jgi:hypothetical protein
MVECGKLWNVKKVWTISKIKSRKPCVRYARETKPHAYSWLAQWWRWCVELLARLLLLRFIKKLARRLNKYWHAVCSGSKNTIRKGVEKIKTKMK